MTEKELMLLGFQKESVDPYLEEEDDYYYALDIVDGLTLITPCASEIRDNNWYLEFFNTDVPVRFHEFGPAQALINTLKNAIVNKD